MNRVDNHVDEKRVETLCQNTLYDQWVLPVDHCAVLFQTDQYIDLVPQEFVYQSYHQGWSQRYRISLEFLPRSLLGDHYFKASCKKLEPDECSKGEHKHHPHDYPGVLVVLLSVLLALAHILPDYVSGFGGWLDHDGFAIDLEAARVEFVLFEDEVSVEAVFEGNDCLADEMGSMEHLSQAFFELILLFDLETVAFLGKPFDEFFFQLGWPIFAVGQGLDAVAVVVESVDCIQVIAKAGSSHDLHIYVIQHRYLPQLFFDVMLYFLADRP